MTRGAERPRSTPAALLSLPNRSPQVLSAIKSNAVLNHNCMPKKNSRRKMRPAKKSILIVEDEPEMLEFYALLLQSAGFNVLTAEHALSAVCALARKKPDVILTDVRMPIVDGFSFVSQLRSFEDT